MLLKYIHIELIKIFKKGRSYIGFAAIAFIVLLIELSIWLDGQNILDLLTQNLTESFYFKGNLLNGYLISYIILNSLWIHIPILVAFVTGDLIAGESNHGTFRMVLSRPVKRSSLLFSKFIAGICYSSILVLLLGFLSLFFGLLIFGQGDLIVVAGKINILPRKDLLWRFICAFSFGILSMGVVTALSFMLSAFSNNSIGPIIGTIAIIIAFSIISTFDIPVFSHLKPVLFTSYLNSWRLFFEFEINQTMLIISTICLLSYLSIFYLVAVIYFNRKNILT